MNSLHSSYFNLQPSFIFLLFCCCCFTNYKPMNYSIKLVQKLDFVVFFSEKHDCLPLKYIHFFCAKVRASTLAKPSQQEAVDDMQMQAWYTLSIESFIRVQPVVKLNKSRHTSTNPNRKHMNMSPYPINWVDR